MQQRTRGALKHLDMSDQIDARFYNLPIFSHQPVLSSAVLLKLKVSPSRHEKAQSSLAKPSKAVPDTDEIVGDSISLFRIPDYIIE